MHEDDHSDEAAFRDALQGLQRGDFSRLEPLFEGHSDSSDRPVIIEWHEQGRLRDHPKVAAEALTCACFLGKTRAAEYLLKQGVNPTGGVRTGLNAFHWAVNRGQLEIVRLLIQWNAPLEPRSMYGGNVLDTAVWSAINEPRPDHLRIIEELLAAGARLEDEEYPTAQAEVDRVLKQHGAV